MSDNLTQRFSGPEDGDKLNQILTIVLSLDTRVRGLDTRLGNLEDKVELRLHDTRPIWEKVQIDIGELKTDVGELKTNVGQLQTTVGQLQADVDELKVGQEFLRRESHEIHTLLRDIFRRLSIFNDTLVTMQADYRDIYDRVRGLERERTS